MLNIFIVSDIYCMGSVSKSNSRCVSEIKDYKDCVKSNSCKNYSPIEGGYTIDLGIDFKGNWSENSCFFRDFF